MRVPEEPEAHVNFVAVEPVIVWGEVIERRDKDGNLITDPKIIAELAVLGE
jgi:hypothetical protein